MTKMPSIMSCHVVRQASREGAALSLLYRSVYTLLRTRAQTSIRYVGVFTDGGADGGLGQYGIDHMCGPAPFTCSCFQILCFFSCLLTVAGRL